MNRAKTTPISPWHEVVEKGSRLGSGDPPLLLLGSLGSLLVDCAKEIHHDASGGIFEHARCTNNSVELRTRLLGPTTWPFSEFDLFNSELPQGAVQRAEGGTLFLEYIDYCHPDDLNWLQDLLLGRRVSKDGYFIELDSSTRVIASITTAWVDGILDTIPQWLGASFEDHMLVLEPLRHRPEDVPGTVAWFFQRETQNQANETILTREAGELLSRHNWPGDLRELARVVRQVISIRACSH